MHLCVNYHRYCYWKCANDATDGTGWYVVLAWSHVTSATGEFQYYCQVRLGCYANYILLVWCWCLFWHVWLIGVTRAGPVPVRIWYCGHVSLYDKSQFCTIQTVDNTDGKVRIEIILLLENNKMVPRKIKTEKKRQNCLQSAAARTADISHVKRRR